jgi:hypothetical protein
MTTAAGTQIDLFAWAKDLERENKRIAEINGGRVRNRGYLVFATDPSKGVDSAEYRQVYATEARTPNQAIAKVRPLADLIDGDWLCDLVKQYELGVHCSVRQIEDVAVDPGFFAEL